MVRKSIDGPKEGENVNPKQRAFATEYVRTGNAAEAARKAGYSERSAASTGPRMLRNAEVQALIASKLEVAEAERVADATEVLAFLTAVVRGQVKDQFGLDASLSDRIKAAQELMKRFAVADMRQSTTLERLDCLLLEFRTAINNDNAE